MSVRVVQSFRTGLSRGAWPLLPSFGRKEWCIQNRKSLPDLFPILIWQLKKAELPELDVHGKNAVNWMISALIYAVVGFILMFVLIGGPLLIVLGVLGVVFPVIAAIKANNGVVWQYPLTIQVLK